MGYLRGLLHGAVAGTVLGICIAPQSGERTRAQLSAFADAAKDGWERAGRTVQKATPLYNAAAQVARSQFHRTPGHTIPAEPLVPRNGNK